MGVGARLVTFGDWTPEVDPEAFVADGATLVGAVRIAAGASVWYAAVVRADGAPIEIGAGSNVQDGCVLHSDPDFPVRVGERCTVGHRAVVHGCTVERRRAGRHGGCRAQRRRDRGRVPGRRRVGGPGGHRGATGLAGRRRPRQGEAAVTDAERERIRSGAESYVTRARRYRDAAGGVVTGEVPERPHRWRESGSSRSASSWRRRSRPCSSPTSVPRWSRSRTPTAASRSGRPGRSSRATARRSCGSTAPSARWRST